MLKAIIFDLDDTLIDWSGSDNSVDWDAIHTHRLGGVFDYLRGKHPLEDIQAYVAEYHRHMNDAWVSSRASLVAPHLGTILVEAATALGVPADCIESQECLDAYRWVAIPGARLFPEVVDMLTLFRDAGVRFGIVTNAHQPMWLRDLELEAFGISDFFPKCRLSAADHGYIKPHPSIFRAALDCLGVEPEEAVFVGDDLDADVGGAKAVGIYTVLRMSRRFPPNLNGGLRPDSLIDSLTELPAILDQQFPGWNNTR